MGQNLGGGSAQLFLSPSDLNLNLVHKGTAASAAARRRRPQRLSCEHGTAASNSVLRLLSWFLRVWLLTLTTSA